MCSYYQSAIDYRKAPARNYLSEFRGAVAPAVTVSGWLETEHARILNDCRAIIEQAEDMPGEVAQYGICQAPGSESSRPMERLLHALEWMQDSRKRECSSALLDAFETIGWRAVQRGVGHDRRFLRVLGAEVCCLIALRLAGDVLSNKKRDFYREAFVNGIFGTTGLIQCLQKSQLRDLLRRVESVPELSSSVLKRIETLARNLNDHARDDSAGPGYRLYPLLFARALHIRTQCWEVADTASDHATWISRIDHALARSRRRHQTARATTVHQRIDIGLRNYERYCSQSTSNEEGGALGRPAGRVGKRSWVKGSPRLFQWGKDWHACVVEQSGALDGANDVTRDAVLFFVQPYIKSQPEQPGKARVLLRDGELRDYFIVLVEQAAFADGLFADSYALGEGVSIDDRLRDAFAAFWRDEEKTKVGKQNREAR